MAANIALNAPARKNRLQEQVSSHLKVAAIYAILLLGAVLVFFPFAWTISTSLKTEQQTLAYPPTWVPDPVQWENYPDALTARPFGRYYVNTTIITTLSVIGQVLSSAVVAYGFARFRFPGRGFIFLVLLSTLMIPFHMLIIPRFILFKYLGWLDTFLPLIAPNFFGGAFSIFLLRQYFLTIPLDLHEAAKMDGANAFQIFMSIILPLARPALGAVGVNMLLDLQVMTPVLSEFKSDPRFLEPALLPGSNKAAFLAGAGNYFSMYDPIHPMYSAFDSLWKQELGEVWIGAASVEEAMGRIADEVAYILDNLADYE